MAMDKNAFEERRRALEEAFFTKQDERLLTRLREKATREALSQASGITDDAVLDRLLAAGVNPSTLTALSLVPLVFVAWADHPMNERERKAVLAAAGEIGIDEGSDGYHLIEQWLAARPPAALFEAWKQSARATVAHLDAAAGAELRATVMRRARRVAEATGGFLGIGSVSAVESETLAAIDEALS